jgi:hypothetical protein
MVSRLGGFVPSGLVGETGFDGDGEFELVELPHPAAASANPTITSVPSLFETERVNIMRPVSRAAPATSVHKRTGRLSRSSADLQVCHVRSVQSGRAAAEVARQVD